MFSKYLYFNWYGKELFEFIFILNILSTILWYTKYWKQIGFYVFYMKAIRILWILCQIKGFDAEFFNLLNKHNTTVPKLSFKLLPTVLHLNCSSARLIFSITIAINTNVHTWCSHTTVPNITPCPLYTCLIYLL